MCAHKYISYTRHIIPHMLYKRTDITCMFTVAQIYTNTNINAPAYVDRYDTYKALCIPSMNTNWIGTA